MKISIILSTTFRIKTWQLSKGWYSKQLKHFYGIEVVNIFNLKSNPLSKAFCKDSSRMHYKGRQFLIITSALH